MLLSQEQEFVAQEWPLVPGERAVKMHLEEPPNGINGNTGMMLALHGWGGVYDNPDIIAFCKFAAERYNLIVTSVNYLQSGTEWTEHRDRPYDHGYLQAMDAIGALYTIREQLGDQQIAFSEHRIYSVGGSGGGNITQMVMKLAPHTFACGIDKCGMPGLTDGIAYGTGEYGSHLDAAYSPDPDAPNYLTADMQEIRDFGNLEHCRLLHQANPGLQIVIIHGVADPTCPVVPKIRQFANMVEAGIDVDAHFLTEVDIDGEVVANIEHSIGNWPGLIARYADEYLKEDGKFARQTEGPSDFMRRETFEYPTTNGKHVIDYSGYPTIAFVSA